MHLVGRHFAPDEQLHHSLTVAARGGLLFALLVVSSCVSGLSGQFHQPGMECQVTRSAIAVALSGQFLVSTRRVPGGMCRRLRGGVMVVVLCRARLVFPRSSAMVRPRRQCHLRR